jgi:hypothetical protein
MTRNELNKMLGQNVSITYKGVNYTGQFGRVTTTLTSIGSNSQATTYEYGILEEGTCMSFQYDLIKDLTIKVLP